jgi:hypothetical protein
MKQTAVYKLMVWYRLANKSEEPVATVFTVKLGKFQCQSGRSMFFQNISTSVSIKLQNINPPPTKIKIMLTKFSVVLQIHICYR